MGVIVAARAIIVEAFFSVNVPTHFVIQFLSSNILSYYDYKDRYKFHLWISALHSKTGIEQPIFIFGWYYKN